MDKPYAVAQRHNWLYFIQILDSNSSYGQADWHNGKTEYLIENDPQVWGVVAQW